MGGGSRRGGGGGWGQVRYSKYIDIPRVLFLPSIALIRECKQLASTNYATGYTQTGQQVIMQRVLYMLF